MLYKLTKQDGLDPFRRGFRRLTGGKDGSVYNTGNRIPSMTPALSKTKRNSTKSDDDSDFEVEEVDFKNGNVLMVDQLWLWAIDTSKPNAFSLRETVP